jgi:hypothetical protein
MRLFAALKVAAKIGAAPNCFAIGACAKGMLMAGIAPRRALLDMARGLLASRLTGAETTNSSRQEMLLFAKLTEGLLLMALCVSIQATGLTAAFRWIRRRARPMVPSFAQHAAVLIGVAAWAIFLHLLQISAWAIFYVWRDAMVDIHSSLYFSAVTYTTTGYGDLVLPAEWRLLGGVEALTGILMCGLSTGFFFAVFAKTFEADERR